MKGTIKIGTTEAELVANAATPYFFKMVFHEDLLKRLNATQAGEEVSDDTTDLIAKMGYIMSLQALGKHPNDVNDGDFFDWLSQYEAFDLLHASKDIFALYLANSQPSSTAKNQRSRQKGK